MDFLSITLWCLLAGMGADDNLKERDCRRKVVASLFAHVDISPLLVTAHNQSDDRELRFQIRLILVCPVRWPFPKFPLVGSLDLTKHPTIWVRPNFFYNQEWGRRYASELLAYWALHYGVPRSLIVDQMRAALVNDKMDEKDNLPNNLYWQHQAIIQDSRLNQRRLWIFLRPW